MDTEGSAKGFNRTQSGNLDADASACGLVARIQFLDVIEHHVAVDTSPVIGYQRHIKKTQVRLQQMPL